MFFFFSITHFDTKINLIYTSFIFKRKENYLKLYLFYNILNIQIYNNYLNKVKSNKINLHFEQWNFDRISAWKLRIHRTIINNEDTFKEIKIEKEPRTIVFLWKSIYSLLFELWETIYMRDIWIINKRRIFN